MRGVADDLVVVAAPDLTPDLPDGVRVAHDAEGGGGPLIGVLAGLSAARHGTVLVVGGDMPWARADVLVLLIVSIEHGHDSAALEFDGRTQQLPLALRRDVALGVVTRLVEAGERRLGALLDGSSVIVIAEGDWRTLDPDAWTIRDVDTRDDLPPD